MSLPDIHPTALPHTLGKARPTIPFTGLTPAGRGRKLPKGYMEHHREGTGGGAGSCPAHSAPSVFLVTQQDVGEEGGHGTKSDTS